MSEAQKKGVRASRMTAPRPRRQQSSDTRPTDGAVLVEFREVLERTINGGSVDALKDIITSLIYIGKELETKCPGELDELFGFIRNRIRQHEMDPYLETLLLKLLEARAMGWQCDDDTLEIDSPINMKLKQLVGERLSSKSLSSANQLFNNNVGETSLDHKNKYKPLLPTINVDLNYEFGIPNKRVDAVGTDALLREIVHRKQPSPSDKSASDVSVCSESSYETCGSVRKRNIGDSQTSQNNASEWQVIQRRSRSSSRHGNRKQRHVRFHSENRPADALSGPDRSHGSLWSRSVSRERQPMNMASGRAQQPQNRGRSPFERKGMRTSNDNYAYDNARVYDDSTVRLPIGADKSYLTNNKPKLRMDRTLENTPKAKSDRPRLLLRFGPSESQALTAKTIGFISALSETTIKELKNADIGTKNPGVVLEIVGKSNQTQKAARLIKAHIKAKDNVKSLNPASFKNLIPSEPERRTEASKLVPSIARESEQEYCASGDGPCKAIKVTEASYQKGVYVYDVEVKNEQLCKMLIESPDCWMKDIKKKTETSINLKNPSTAKSLRVVGSTEIAIKKAIALLGSMADNSNNQEKREKTTLAGIRASEHAPKIGRQASVESSTSETSLDRFSTASENTDGHSTPTKNKNRVRKPSKSYLDFDQPTTSSEDSLINSWVGGVQQMHRRRRASSTDQHSSTEQMRPPPGFKPLEDLSCSQPYAERERRKSAPNEIQTAGKSLPGIPTTGHSLPMNQTPVSITVPPVHENPVPITPQSVRENTIPRISKPLHENPISRTSKPVHGSPISITSNPVHEIPIPISSLPVHKIPMPRTGQPVHDIPIPVTSLPINVIPLPITSPPVHEIPLPVGPMPMPRTLIQSQEPRQQQSGAGSYSAMLNVKGKILNLQSSDFGIVQVAKKLIEDFFERNVTPTKEQRLNKRYVSQEVQVDFQPVEKQNSSVCTQTDEIQNSKVVKTEIKKEVVEDWDSHAAYFSNLTLAQPSNKPTSLNFGTKNRQDREKKSPTADEIIFSEEDDRALDDELEKAFRKTMSKSLEPLVKAPACPKEFKVNTTNRFEALGSGSQSPDVTSTPMVKTETSEKSPVLRAPRLQLNTQFGASVGNQGYPPTTNKVGAESKNLRWPPTAEKRAPRDQSDSICSLGSDVDLEGLVRKKMEESYQSVATSCSAQSTSIEDVTGRCWSPTDTESISSMDSASLSRPSELSSRIIREPIGVTTSFQTIQQATRDQPTSRGSPCDRRQRFMQTSLRKSFEDEMKTAPQRSSSGVLRYGRQFLFACARSPWAKKPLNEWEHMAKLLPDICLMQKTQFFDPMAYTSPQRGVIPATSRDLSRERANSRERTRSRSRSRSRMDTDSGPWRSGYPSGTSSEGSWRCSQNNNSFDKTVPAFSVRHSDNFMRINFPISPGQNNNSGPNFFPPSGWNWRANAGNNERVGNESNGRSTGAPRFRPAWSFS